MGERQTTQVYTCGAKSQELFKGIFEFIQVLFIAYEDFLYKGTCTLGRIPLSALWFYNMLTDCSYTGHIQQVFASKGYVGADRSTRTYEFNSVDVLPPPPLLHDPTAKFPELPVFVRMCTRLSGST